MAGGGGGEATDFDLTALMDVLSNIIFFLMASFGAAVVAVLPASVPTISEAGDNDTARETDKVTVTMLLRADGSVDISAANNDMLPEELAPLAKKIAGKGGKLDHAEVNGHLWAIKSQYKESKNIVIVPDDKVTYELLVDAMDVSRERHMVADGKSVYPQMFPAVVVSSMVK
ncbi:MAG: biopolymer transporter ExbD [Ilumatobacter sp.]|nr:biopolymer transporter ExbD [Ilumatobacter sp.]